MVFYPQHKVLYLSFTVFSSIYNAIHSILYILLHFNEISSNLNDPCSFVNDKKSLAYQEDHPLVDYERFLM